MEFIKVSNPKRNHNSYRSKAGWYNYYAGYSSEFVEDIIKHIKIMDTDTILDPWNGSGTTTEVAEKMGINAIGYDINPVMVVVANAKRIDNKTLKFTENKSSNIVKAAKKSKVQSFDETDALLTWLNPDSVLPFRKLEKFILRENPTRNKNIIRRNDFKDLTSESAFYYLALFKTIKELLGVFKSSNPTWIKRPKSSDERLDLKPIMIYNTFLKHVKDMSNSASEYNKSDQIRRSKVVLSVGSSLSLPIERSSIDAVITSPPYCTRIDYAIATILELALLGYSTDEYLKKLRNNMIGTPTIIKNNFMNEKEWGKTANEFLLRVSNHTSKASSTYYNTFYSQYFAGIQFSLKEIDRVLKSGGKCVLVVQNSYYKDILLDLSKIFIEMGEHLGWNFNNMIEYENKRTLASIHRDTKKYRTNFSTSESILIFTKCK